MQPLPKTLDAGLTVVIPVRDRAGMVGATLASVAAQTYRPMHVVLVDNGSTDSTRDVLDRWAQETRSDDFTITVICEARPGECCARNAGMEVVRTEWVMAFDSDDIMYPDHVARAMQAITENPDADIINWPGHYIWRGRQLTTPHSGRHYWFRAITSGQLSPHRYCVRTDMVRRAGMWDNDIMLHGDLDMAIRLLKLNPVIVSLSSPTYKINENDGSMTRGRAEDIVRRSLTPWRIMAGRVPGECRRWLEFARIYIWALTGHCDLGEAGVTDADIGTGSLWRLWLKCVYIYTSHGGRGAFRLFSLFSSKSKMP